MASKEELQKALDSLWERYGNTLAMLDDALEQLDKKPKEVVREVVVPLSAKQEKQYIAKIKALEEKLKAKPKEVTVEVEKVVEKEKIVEKPVEVEKIVEVIKEVEVPGPERIVEKPVEVIKEVIKEKVVEGPRRPVKVEAPATGDLKEAARLMANSELNKEDLSEDEIFEIIQKLSEEEVNNNVGFWAIQLPTDTDNDDDSETRYQVKK